MLSLRVATPPEKLQVKKKTNFSLSLYQQQQQQIFITQIELFIIKKNLLHVN